MLSVEFRYQPRFEDAVKECRRDASEDTADKEDENVVEQNAEAASRVSDAKALTSKPSAMDISQ